MDMQIAEAAGQIALLQRRDRLIAEEQHLMLQQGMIKLFKLAVAQRPGQFDVFHQRPDVRPQR